MKTAQVDHSLKFLSHLGDTQFVLVAALLVISLAVIAGFSWKLIKYQGRKLFDWIDEKSMELWFNLRFKDQKDGVRIGSKWLPDSARVRHTHIVGATGSGKSVLLENLILSDIQRGHGMVIIDPKGDYSFMKRVEKACGEAGRGRDFKLLSTSPMENSAVWNPCGLGNVSELQSKFYNSAIYAEPHYAKHCERALLRAFDELEQEKPEGYSLTHLIRQLEILSDNGKDKNTEGLFLDLHNLNESEWGPVLCGGKERPDGEELNLWDIVNDNMILFVSLPTEAKAVQSQRVGRLLLQELTLVSGLLKSAPEDLTWPDKIGPG